MRFSGELAGRQERPGNPGEKYAVEQVFVKYEYLVVGIARRIIKRFPTIDVEDVLQQGRLGLLVAWRRYDRGRAKFITYASYYIEGYVRDFILRNISVVQSQKTKRQRSEFWRTSSKNWDDLSVDAPVADGNGRTFADMLPWSGRPADEELISVENRAVFEHIRTLLPDRDRQIFDSRLYTDDPARAEELAGRLGITSSRVNQLERKCVTRVRKLWTVVTGEVPGKS